MPGKGAIKKEAKKPGSTSTGKVLGSKKEGSLGGSKDPSLSPGSAISSQDDPKMQQFFCVIANADVADVSRDLPKC